MLVCGLGGSWFLLCCLVGEVEEEYECEGDEDCFHIFFYIFSIYFFIEFLGHILNIFLREHSSAGILGGGCIRVVLVRSR